MDAGMFESAGKVLMVFVVILLIFAFGAGAWIF